MLCVLYHNKTRTWLMHSWLLNPVSGLFILLVWNIHLNLFKKYLFIYLFIYFWLCWIFVSVRGLSLVAESGGHSSSWCAGLSLSRPLLLWSTGSRRAGSVVVAHGPSCSAACGILPDQGSNLCPLHWQADSQPLRHQGSPTLILMPFVLNSMLPDLTIATTAFLFLLFLPEKDIFVHPSYVSISIL